jgi:threonine-phosphate decarboxylase
METSPMTTHGGDVWQMAEELGLEATDLLDFSANVNPRGLPRRAIARLTRDADDAALLKLYPDPSARRLKRTLAGLLDVPDQSIVVGAGAEALLAPVLRVALLVSGEESVLVPVPAFSEYRRICEQLSVEFEPWPLEQSEDFRLPVGRLCDRLRAGTVPGAMLLNNPHNPSGALLDRSDMSRIVNVMESAGIGVVLDEAFIDYTPGHSLVTEAASRPGLIVVRSLTKFYGCPALRVGYAVSHPDTIAQIRSTLPTWSVSQLAMDALSEALVDADFVHETLLECESERIRVADTLARLGLKVVPSAANYLLVRLNPSMPDSAELRLQLARDHRILIRNCDSYEGLEKGRWIRLAIRSPHENTRLVSALNSVLKVELSQP